MKDLDLLETRGYTTAFFDGVLGPEAHNYETTRSSSDYHAAGVITSVDSDNIILELRNEIKQGDDITFLLPKTTEKLSINLPKIINAKSGEELPKMSAGQHNSIIIPFDWVKADGLKDKFVPYVLAYKHK